MKHVIPLASFSCEEEAQAALSAISESGLDLCEIAFRTPYAEEAFSFAARRFPDILLGAGTVLDGKTAKRAIELGAKFIVSPGLSEEVLGVCREAGVFYLPGAVTPTELMRALSLGVSAVKFFPAEVYGGLKAISALSAPFPQVKFVVTGGVNLENLKDYLLHPAVCAVGGSFMLKGDALSRCKQTAEIQKTV